MTYRIIQGDNRLKLKDFPDNHFDSVVCDPPYGIDFLGKSWDADTGSLETYRECLRVLKPGGHLLAFSAARTYHHLAITLEQAGFEIRDQIMWIYSSGFPKSQDVGRSIQRSLGVKETKASKGMNAYAEVKDKKGKEKWMNPGNVTTEDYPEKKAEVVVTDPEAKAWAGWGTALKPAHEPICLARKPTKLSIAKNVQKYGTGALNIDACRIGDDPMIIRHLKKDDGKAFTHHGDGKKNWDSYEDIGTVEGRFPSNVIGEIADGYQKYFYCPKVSRKERHIGFEDPGPRHPGADGGGYQVHNVNDAVIVKGQGDQSGNNHPTVKPVELMKYLIKLVTPANGTVLDPFCGSGSTGMAAVELGYAFVGIELDANYCQIASKRIAAWNEKGAVFRELFE